MNAELNVEVVIGGFILSSTDVSGTVKTEVFTSQGKLMKAVRTFIDEHSLVKKEAVDSSTE